jgi:acetyl esterase
LRALVYRPVKSESALPVILYLHGGGWSMGVPEDADLLARKLCRQAGAIVVSLAYRLAPEFPYPQGLEDCIAGYQWIRRNAESDLKASPDHLVVAGDSSGGNLAMALALRIRDAGQKIPDALLLLCPATDLHFERYESFKRLAPSGLVYDSAFAAFARSAYVPDPDRWDDPYISPMQAYLGNLCPTIIIAATEDPLIDENRAFAQKLHDAENQVELIVYDAMPHAFYYFMGLVEQEKDVYRSLAEFVSRVLPPVEVGSRQTS